MKAIVLGLILAIASSSALAHETKKQRYERHKHVQLLHREHKIVQRWMDKAEVDCAHFHGDEFDVCYKSSIRDQRAAYHQPLSPETEHTIHEITKVRRKRE